MLDKSSWAKIAPVTARATVYVCPAFVYLKYTVVYLTQIYTVASAPTAAGSVFMQKVSHWFWKCGNSVNTIEEMAKVVAVVGGRI